MSKGYKVNGRTKIIEGPLKQLEEYIVAVDKKSHEAVLNIEFLNKKLKAGIEMQNNEVLRRGSRLYILFEYSLPSPI